MPHFHRVCSEGTLGFRAGDGQNSKNFLNYPETAQKTTQKVGNDPIKQSQKAERDGGTMVYFLKSNVKGQIESTQSAILGKA